MTLVYAVLAFKSGLGIVRRLGRTAMWYMPRPVHELVGFLTGRALMRIDHNGDVSYRWVDPKDGDSLQAAINEESERWS